MKIFLITSEIAPYSGVSALAALSATLPKALRGVGHQATVVTPLYRTIDPGAHALARRLSTIPVQLDGETGECAIYDGRTTGGVDLLFVGHPAFGDEPVVDDTPAARRNALVLSQAAAELARTREPACDVIHALGFQAALSLPLAKAGRPKVGTVLSPFDLERQGKLENSEAAGVPNLAQALSGGTPPNLLAAGARAAERIVTNSPTLAVALAKHQLAPELTEALEGRSDAVLGVLEGVDAAVWNPLVDPHLTARFDPADLSGKDQCKGALQYELGLSIRPDTPIIGVLADNMDDSELVDALKGILRNDVQIALACRGDLPASVSALLEEFDDQVKPVDRGDDDAVHRLFGGADFLWTIMGEHPTASPHLAAQRYGTLAIVSDSGVTGETVVDCDAQLETGSGFVYGDSPGAALSALQRALSAYAQPDAFEALRRRAMRMDTSWERAARRYEHIYRSIIEP